MQPEPSTPAGEAGAGVWYGAIGVAMMKKTKISINDMTFL